MGGKAAGLSTLMTEFPVSPGFVVPASWIEDRLPDGVVRGLRDDLGALDQLRGENLLRLRAAVAGRLAGMRLPDDAADTVRTAAAAAVGDSRLVVRSSERDEDSRLYSAAGIYESMLDVTSDDLPAAVLRCWASSFGLAALALLARRRRADALGAMNVLVQAMVPVALGGVAVTSGDIATIDVAPTGTDAVVSGRVAAERTIRPLLGGPPGEPWQQLLLAALCAGRRDMGSEVDVEFGVEADGRLTVFQCRPAGDRLVASLGGDTLRTEPLYDSRLPLGDGLDPGVRTVAAEMRDKRVPVFAVARTLGAATAEGWIVRWDRRCRPEDLRSWLSMVGRTVVLDLGPELRQIITGAPEATSLLHELAGVPDSSCIVRPYLKGSAALVVSADAAGGLVISVGQDGLLALNRGTAAAVTLALPADADRLADVVGALAARTVADVSVELLERGLLSACEWVVVDGEPILVDFSRPSRPAADRAGRSTGANSADGTEVAGPALVVDDQEELVDLSVAPLISVGQPVDVDGGPAIGRLLGRLDDRSRRPVLVAPRPYAIFAVVLEHVAAVLVQEGSTLSHLGLQAAEAGVPFIVDETAADISDGQRVVFRYSAESSRWVLREPTRA